jgi:hypothetical protein
VLEVKKGSKEEKELWRNEYDKSDRLKEENSIFFDSAYGNGKS